MGWVIGHGNSFIFRQGGGGKKWSSYWLTRYISALSVLTTSDTEQTITPTIVGTGYDGVSFEYSTDNITFTVAGTNSGGAYSATGLLPATTYYWRARLYKGTNYGSYKVDYGITSANTALIAGWKLDTPDYFSNTMADLAMADLINKHSAVCFNGVTYIAYMGDGTDPYITTYTHATGIWATPVKIGDNPLGVTDGHGEPSIMLDSSGYIHCMWGCHVSEMLYAKSDSPEDISAWTAMTSPVADDSTYPQLFQLSGGTIYLFYRQGSDNTDSEWGYRTSTDSGATWSNFTIVVHGSGDFAYCLFEKGFGDTFHCFFNKGISTVNRQNIYYIFFNGTNWVNISGAVQSLPITIANTSVLAYDSGTEWVPLPNYSWDDDNNVYCLFTEGHGADPVSIGPGSYSYKFLKHNGSSWVSYSIGRSVDYIVFNSCIDAINANNIECYLTGNRASVDRGGNVEKLVSSDGGVTWTLDSFIKEGRFIHPSIVINYHADAKVLFSDYTAETPATYTRKAYLWGASGFVKNTALLATTAHEINDLYLGTVVNAPAKAVGKFNECYSFVGASLHYIEVNDNDVFSFNSGSPDKPFTFTLWVNTTSTAGLQALISKSTTGGLEWMLYINEGTIGGHLINGANSLTSTAPFTTTNEWKFICFTYDGSANEANLKVFIDCIESQTVQTEGGTFVGFANTTAKVMIARRQVAATPYYFTGLLDEIKLYNKVLSPTEMALVMADKF